MKTKKLLPLLLTLVMLLGCAPAPQADPVMPPPPVVETPAPEPVPDPIPEPEGPEYLLTLEEYPRMDGSTANLPLMAAVLSAATGLDRAEAEGLVDCTTTSWSWTHLAQGNKDILLVYEASADTKAQLAELGTELEITPIGLDALVFIVNEQNPVESLTQDQLKSIYSGKITNWSRVGGEDMEILPFQRPESSGSQSLFRKLLFPETAPMEAPTEFRPSEMGMLIDTLASYNNAGNALGYSVFYYASYMYSQPGLRFLAVDGIAPSDETIADQSYPLLNPFYVVIRADEPTDSPARILRDWLLTDEGRAVIQEAGYIPYEAQEELCGYPKAAHFRVEDGSSSLREVTP